jgi:hypothetical protein
MKEDTSVPPVSTEALFLTAVVDAHEGWKVILVDVPGVLMHCNMNELIHVKLEGVMARMMVRINPERYVHTRLPPSLMAQPPGLLLITFSRSMMRQRSSMMNKQQHSTILPPRSSTCANYRNPTFRWRLFPHDAHYTFQHR